MSAYRNLSSSRISYTNETSDDTTFKHTLAAFMEWYTLAIVLSGVGLSVASIFYVTRNSQSLIFLPHLFLLAIGNIGFLLLLGANLILRRISLHLGGRFCKFFLYLMSVTRELPYLCMVSVSIEQFLVIFCNTFAKVRATHPKRQLAITLLVFSVCATTNIWTIFLAESDENFFCLLNFPPTESILKRVRLLCLLTVDFAPIILMSVCHAGLIYKLCTQIPYSSAATSVSSQQSTIGTTQRCTVHSAALNGRKKTVLQLIVVVTGVALLNMPKIIINTLDSYEPENSQPLAFSTLAYILYHLQYVVGALYVRLPLFTKRNRSPEPPLVRGQINDTASLKSVLAQVKSSTFTNQLEQVEMLAYRRRLSI